MLFVSLGSRVSRPLVLSHAGFCKGEGCNSEGGITTVNISHINHGRVYPLGAYPFVARVLTVTHIDPRRTQLPFGGVWEV